MNKMKESISQFQQSMQHFPTNQGQFKGTANSPPVASSLDYLYQAISLIETKNNNNNINNGANNNTNGANNNNANLQFFQAQNSTQHGTPITSNIDKNLNLLGKDVNQNILNQQTQLINNVMNQASNQNRDYQNKRYNNIPGQLMASGDQINHLYNAQATANGHTNPMDQSQFSVVDCRRYFNSLIYHQQLQKSQQQQQQQKQQLQINCTDPYCNCLNKSVINSNLPPKYNTMHNIIGQHHYQQQQHQQMLSLNSSLQKLSKSPSSKVIKQRRNENERINERRINNLVQLSQQSSSQLPLSPHQNKKNISKLLQTSHITKDLAIMNENDYLTNKAIPSRLEKAKQLARKQQNSLKLNLNTPELQIIERDGLLTPLSTSSANSSSPSLISSDSPMSQTPLSPISPKYSPTMPLPTQQPQGTSGLGQPSVFNYYPADMMNNLIPLYLAPYLSNLNSNIPSGSAPLTPTTPNSTMSNFYQSPASQTNNGLATSNIDQLYFQNLVTAIYTIANYQQQQHQNQQYNINSNRPSLNNQRAPLLPNLSFNPTINNGNHNNKQNIYDLNNSTSGANSSVATQSKTHGYPLHSTSEHLPNLHRTADLAKTGSDKYKQLSLNLSDTNKSECKPSKPLVDIQNKVPMNKLGHVKKASKSTFSYKLISYIGTDIEGKVDEHFRRSLGGKYNQVRSSSPTVLEASSEHLNSTLTSNDAASGTNNNTNSTNDNDNDINNNNNDTNNFNNTNNYNNCHVKLVTNEHVLEEEANSNPTEEKNSQNKDWRDQNATTTNLNDFCDCSNYDCGHLEHGSPARCVTEDAQHKASDNFNENTVDNSQHESYDDELIDYDSDSGDLIDYSNDEVLASNPVSPVSTASYSYSVISQTSDMIPEEANCLSSDARDSEQPDDIMSGLLAANNKHILSSS